MEAPFRFPITGLVDLERLLDILATTSQLVPGSLRLAEGLGLLVEQLNCEGRLEDLSPALSSGNYQELLRRLWQQPLESQHPRFLRFNAQVAGDPGFELSMRVDVPTTGAWPRWVDLEGSRDPERLASLRKVYRSIGREAQLALLEI